MRTFSLTVILLFNISFISAQNIVDDKGNKYSGESLDGKPHGKGMLINRSGTIFDGYFENGEIVSGIMKFSDESRIINCTFKHGKLIHGTYIFTSDAKYEGGFKNDKFDGEGTYYYPSSSKYNVQYKGAFKNGKFNGKGTRTKKNGAIEDGEWKDNRFLGEIIGTYGGEPVLKKGDSIFTYNNVYLLSEQSSIGNDNENRLAPIIPNESFIIETDLQGRKNFIGYIAMKESMPTSMGLLKGMQSKEDQEYTKNSTGTFVQLDCVAQDEQYNNLIQYCNERIAKMERTINAASVEYKDYEEMINEDKDLNTKIITSRFKEIFIQASSDIIGSTDKTGWIKNIENKLQALNLDANTSVKDFFVRNSVNMLIAPAMNDDIAKTAANQFVNCGFTVGKDISKIAGADVTWVNKSFIEYVKELATDKDRNRMETELGKQVKNWRDLVFDVADDCLPKETSTQLKKHWLYHVLKNSPEAGEIVMMTAANISIKFFIEPEVKKGITDRIKKYKEKINLLTNLREEYVRKSANNKEGCLGRLLMMRELSERCKSKRVDAVETEEYSYIREKIFKE
jgi:hypothetical protein